MASMTRRGAMAGASLGLLARPVTAAVGSLAPDEIAAPFAGWEVLHDSVEEFPALGDKVKRFRTLIARRPA